MEAKKWIGTGINTDLKDSVSNNVLNVVRAIVEDKDSTVYIPNSYISGSKYRTTSDPAVHFLPTECGKAVKVVGIQSHQERFNFSLICLVNVIVEFEKEDGTVELKDKKIFRQYNIIRDRVLTVDYLSARLSEGLFEDLKKLGILYYNGVAVPDNHMHNKDYVYKIVIKGLPLVSTSWAQPIRIGLVDLMREEDEISTKLSVLKILKKEYDEGVFHTGEESDIYYEKKGKTESVDRDLIDVDCVVYKINNLEKYTYTIEQARDEYHGYNDVVSAIEDLNKKLRYCRFIIRCVTYSIESCKQKNYDWSDVYKLPRCKNKYGQDCTIDVNGKEYILTRLMYTVKA